MKIRLVFVGRLIREIKIDKKNFPFPYFEDISKSPILEIEDEKLPELYDFFVKFNSFLKSTGIALHGVCS